MGDRGDDSDERLATVGKALVVKRRGRFARSVVAEGRWCEAIGVARGRDEEE